MSYSVLDIRLVNDCAVGRGEKVIFDFPVLTPPGIAYDKTSGVITFKETGQFSIKWWIATETMIKETVGFRLESSQDSFATAPGASPIKTGQVTGFGFIDVEAPETTLTLVNKSDTETVISKKSKTKGYMLITPIGYPSTRVYRGNLSVANSFIEVPLGNGLFYRLENSNATRLRLALVPINNSVRYDYRRFSSYNGSIATEGNYSDDATLSARDVKDGDIYNNSQEMHWVLIRVQNQDTNLWSTYEVRFFASNGISRVTVWVNVIEEEVSY